MHDTDSEWKKWGKENPYFAVITDPKYKEGEGKVEFMLSGKKYFEDILQDFNRLSIPLNRDGNALDYGCGVGRVLKPISEYFKSSTGIDVSSHMLEEARKNCNKEKTELRLFTEYENLSNLLDNSYSFIHTLIVLQHIPIQRGLKILEQLLLKLDFNGRAIIEVPIISTNKLKYNIHNIATIHPILFKLLRLAKKRDWNSWKLPIMEMNIYPSSRLIQIFSKTGCEVRWIKLEYTDINKDLISASWYLSKTTQLTIE